MSVESLNEIIRMYFKRQDQRNEGTLSAVEDLSEFDTIID